MSRSEGSSSGLRRKRQWAAGTLGLVLLCSACAAPGSGDTTGAPPTTAVSSTSSVPAGQPLASVPKPVDRLAPSAYVPVIRHGNRPSPSVHARAGSFSPAGPATYTDGVSLTVNRVSHRVESGEGPGVFPGRPYTAVFLTLHNRSTKAIDLNQVVVTATYGSPARIASPVYEDPAANDFAGTVRRGGSASATYLFAIPPRGRAGVVMVVDFDGAHVAARFTGALR